jgi:hypothetical protein
VALFGAIFVATLRAHLPPALALRLPHGGANLDGEQLAGLPSSLRVEFMHGFEVAIHRVFLAGAVAAAVGFVLALNLRDVPLRRGHGRVAQPPADAAKPAAGMDTNQTPTR